MKRLSHALSIILLVGIVAGGLASCASPSAAPVADVPAEIRIGVLSKRTGPGAEDVWPYTTNGASLFESQVNADGGVQIGEHRMPVKVILADDMDNPEGGSTAALHLINQEQVVALAGTTSSRVAIPVGAIAEQAGIPFVAHVSTNPQTTAGKKFVFRAIFLDQFQGKVLARFVRTTLKLERAAVLYDIADVYCRSLAEAFQQEFEALGGQMVAIETYTTDNLAWGEQLERIAQLTPDVLFLPNQSADISEQVVDVRAAGIEATLLGGDSWDLIPPDKRPAFEGSYFASGYAVDSPSEENRAFVAAYRAAYNEDPTSEVAHIYDALGMIKTAIESQGSSDPAAIRDGLAGLHAYAGVTGTMQFAGTGDPAKSITVMHVQDGELVWFEEVQP